MPPFKKILIKLSGDALGGQQGFGIDRAEIVRFGEEILSAFQQGVQIGVVIGGGNILRGAQESSKGMDRVTSDHMGMLATVINGLAIKERLDTLNIPTIVMSAIEIHGVCETFSRNTALHHLQNNRVVVFVGGTGNPFFTTDSAAALRAAEIGADALLKATKVDGIYDKDPIQHQDATKYENISYQEVLEKRLNVMDAAAISLCRENRLPIHVFNFTKAEQLKNILSGEKLGSIVKED